MRWSQIYRFRFRTIIALDHTNNRYSIRHDGDAAAHWLDPRLQWTFLGFGVKGAEALLQATVTATLSFLAFTFASLLVALQVASGQLTPRIIATILLSNNIVRYTVGLFIFTLLFAIGAQNRLETTVYQLPLFVAAVLASLCFAAFLFLIDYASRLLRPISILTQVANDGLSVIENVLPLSKSWSRCANQSAAKA